MSVIGVDRPCLENLENKGIWGSLTLPSLSCQPIKIRRSHSATNGAILSKGTPKQLSPSSLMLCPFLGRERKPPNISLTTSSNTLHLAISVSLTYYLVMSQPMIFLGTIWPFFFRIHCIISLPSFFVAPNHPSKQVDIRNIILFSKICKLRRLTL